jgi:hypothetical protein
VILMIKWYNKILEKIKQNQFDCLFIKDKAGLMNSEDLKHQIKELYPVIYNFYNEIDLRMFLKKTAKPVLILINKELYFPSDLENKYYIMEIDYNDVFPELDKTALNWLNISEFQELFYLYKMNEVCYQKLNYQETLSFVLKNLYDIDIPINNKEQLVSLLIKYYFVNNRLKGALKEYIKDFLSKWDMEFNSFLNRDNYYDWLNQEWRIFFRDKKCSIDFNDRTIKYLLNDCFDQGLMKQIDLMREEFDKEFIIKEASNNYWYNIGLKNLDKISLMDDFRSKYRILDNLLNRDLNIREWGTAARYWAKLVYLKQKNDLDKTLYDIRDRLDRKFLEFINTGYDNLAYDQRFHYAPLNNRILAYVMERKANKFAIICFDCLSFKEWPIIKEYLINRISISFKEDFSIAIIPTVTLYSRRAIFSGVFPLEINEYGDEGKLFKNYLEKNLGINREEILFKRSSSPEKLDFLGYRAVGLIYNFVDDLVHTAQNHQMLFDNIENNLHNNELDKVIKSLLSDGFTVFFTSDHGNIFAEGNGYNPERQLVEDKASRVLLYTTDNLARNENFDNNIVLNFPNILGDNYVVTMTDRRKFGNKEPGFTHGGINIEEVIVPFIEVIG